MSGERRRYVVSYDITTDHRLRAIHRVVDGFGDRLQYSVYLCDLDDRERLALEAAVVDIIDHRSDKVCFIDLGVATRRGTECFQFFGVKPTLPRTGDATIV